MKLFNNIRKIPVLSFLTIVVLILFGCNRVDRFHIYSLDKSKCITVFNYNNVRYIIDGKHQNIPDTNYVKLSIPNTSPIDDAMHISWNGEYEWDIVVNKSTILESKLDNIKFNVSTQLPKDKDGIPSEIKFRKEGCAIFSFYSMDLSPNKGAIIEFMDRPARSDVHVRE